MRAGEKIVRRRGRPPAGWRRAACLALLVLGAGACGGADTRRDDLLQAVRSFNEALRWATYESAARWVPADRREAFLAGLRDGVGPRRITEFTIRRLRVEPGPVDRAVAVVEMAWYRLPDTTVHTEVRYQTWRYEGRRWWMTEESTRDPDADGGAAAGSGTAPPR